MSALESGVSAEFLMRHELTEDDLFDAQGAPPRLYGPEMEEIGKLAAFNVAPCRICRKSLRSRKGKCLHCHPSTLAFTRRRFYYGTVYICGSRKLRLLKVGATHKQDIPSRIAQLRSRSYGGADDWTLLFSAESMAYFIEEAAQLLLSQWHVSMPYFDSTLRRKLAREVFRCNAQRAVEFLKTFDLLVRNHLSEHELQNFQFETTT